MALKVDGDENEQLKKLFKIRLEDKNFGFGKLSLT